MNFKVNNKVCYLKANYEAYSKHDYLRSVLTVDGFLFGVNYWEF